jgi:hypothetical protein
VVPAHPRVRADHVPGRQHVTHDGGEVREGSREQFRVAARLLEVREPLVWRRAVLDVVRRQGVSKRCLIPAGKRLGEDPPNDRTVGGDPLSLTACLWADPSLRMPGVIAATTRNK